MLVTGGAQQVVEAQEGGVELWDEVLTEVGATRGQPWSVAAHEKWARAREAWINGGEVKSVFTRVFNALKTIFTNIYTNGALTKHRNPVLEKAFVKIYDINTAPAEDVKAKVAREIGYEASKLIPYIPAGKLQKAQSLIESAKLIQDLGDAKEHLRKSASTLNQSDPEYNEQEVEKMEAVLEESMTGKEVQKGEPIYDTVDSFLKAQKNEQPTLTVIDEKADERKQLTFFQNLKKSIEAIMLSARNEVGMYPQDRLNELEAYFSEVIKLKPSDLAQIVYTADTDENLSQWMTSDMKSALRFLMNVLFVGYDEIRSILQKNPSDTIVTGKQIGRAHV